MNGETGKIGPYDLNTIVTGDARELARAIPNESVDLIFTDPVYDRIDDYRWLAETAARVLVQGGSIVAQAGTRNRFEAERAMYSVALDRRPLLAEIQTGGGYQMWADRTVIGWKPYIWMSRGFPAWDWMRDILKGGGQDKRVHIWGDSVTVFANWINRLVSVCAIVFDPFTGGGTVPAVCKMLQRDYIAFEIDPDTAAMARQRVAETQPPLPIVMAEQQGFDLAGDK